MDKYNVKFMSRALRDLDGIYEYIARTLLEPNTAMNLVEQIEKGSLVCRLPFSYTRSMNLCIVWHSRRS